MTKYDVEAREKIITATAALIQQHGEISRITVRDIAANAGVGVGLINYHFQTKENLINLCVQRIIGKVISQFDAMYHGLEMAPMDKLRYLVKSTASFLADYPGLSRISITTDLLAPNSGDNSEQTAQAYRQVLKEIYGDKKTDMELSVLLHCMISSLQVAFLRNEVVKTSLSLNFSDKSQREALVDMILDAIFCA